MSAPDFSDLEVFDKERIRDLLKLRSVQQVERLMADPECPLHGNMHPIRGTRRKGCDARTMRAMARWILVLPAGHPDARRVEAWRARGA